MKYSEILEACWKGYRQAGMKKKGDRMVPNCVPVEEVKTGPEMTLNDLLYTAAAKAMHQAWLEGVSMDYEEAIKKAAKIYRIPYTPSELPRLLAQRAEIDRKLTIMKQGKQAAKARRKEKLAPTPAGAEEYWRTHALPTDRIKPSGKTLEEATDIFLDNAARDMMAVLSMMAVGFGYGIYVKIRNKLDRYQGYQIVAALEDKGVTMNRATYEKVKPVLDQFKQALKDDDGAQAKELAKRIQQMVIMGKLSAPEPNPADSALAAKERELQEDLKKWFKEKWVRFGPDGKIRGDCARGSSSEGKPKCLPQSKAHALGKKGRASAAAKKRREDPNPERRGPARNVATKVREQGVAESSVDNNAKLSWVAKKLASETGIPGDRKDFLKAAKRFDRGYTTGGMDIIYDMDTDPRDDFFNYCDHYGAVYEQGVAEMDKSQKSQERHGDYPVGAKGTTAKPVSAKKVVKDLARNLDKAFAKEKKVKEQYTDDDDWYDEEDDRLRDGDYVRDRQDGEYGEIFRMSGDPTERRVRILDRDGRGWYISPDRLEPVDRNDPDIMKYFGKRRQRDMDEATGDPRFDQMMGRIVDPVAALKQDRVYEEQLEDYVFEFMNEFLTRMDQLGIEVWLDNPRSGEDLTNPKFAQAYEQASLKAVQKFMQRKKLDTNNRRLVAQVKADFDENADQVNPVAGFLGSFMQGFTTLRPGEIDILSKANMFKKPGQQELDEKQDACYRKVKSRYKVWPSAYASGALVQCRKKGAANWGNKGKK